MAQHGELSPEIVAMVSKLFFERMPYRRIADFMTRPGMKIGTATVSNISSGSVAHWTAPPRSMVKMRQARVLHADEASIHPNGRNVWIRVHRSRHKARHVCDVPAAAKTCCTRWSAGTGRVLCVRRMKAVPPHTTYSGTVHLTREAGTIAAKMGTPATIEMAESLSRIVNNAKKWTGGRHDGGRRAAKRRECIRAVQAGRQIRVHRRLRAFCTKLGNAAADTFWFVADPSIPDNNNTAEQYMREPVIHRKMRGCLRAESSMDDRQPVYVRCDVAGAGQGRRR